MDIDPAERASMHSPRAFMTSLLSSLPSLDGNVSGKIPTSAKSHILTLHGLLPNTLLPAFDLLDRKLVTRYIISSANIVYYVRSSQPPQKPGAHSRPISAGRSYEVRTLAWNCTCPAFAFAAYCGSGGLDLKVEGSDLPKMQDGTDWVYGGVALEDNAPICKHLLACVLAEKWSEVLAINVEEGSIGKEVCAGWAGGWASI